LVPVSGAASPSTATPAFSAGAPPPSFPVPVDFFVGVFVVALVVPLGVAGDFPGEPGRVVAFPGPLGVAVG